MSAALHEGRVSCCPKRGQEISTLNADAYFKGIADNVGVSAVMNLYRMLDNI